MIYKAIDYFDELQGYSISNMKPVFYDTYQNTRMIVDLDKSREEEAPIEATM